MRRSGDAAVSKDSVTAGSSNDRTSNEFQPAAKLHCSKRLGSFAADARLSSEMPAVGIMIYDRNFTIVNRNF
jgi:hypothetical protein